MKRQHKPTSKAGENFIAPFKQSHKEKIVEALKKLPVGATHEELSDATGLRPDQVWKRLSECANDGKIFDSGLTRKLNSGVMGIIWKSTEEAMSLGEWFLKHQEEKPPTSFHQTSLFDYENQYRDA